MTVSPSSSNESLAPEGAASVASGGHSLALDPNKKPTFRETLDECRMLLDRISRVLPRDPLSVPTSSQQPIVRRFELSLLLPIDVSGLESNDKDELGQRNATERLKQRVKVLINSQLWSEIEAEFPSAVSNSPQFELQSLKQSAIEFSDWAYFHPHVRNFLFVNAHERRSDSSNRNLRTLRRNLNDIGEKIIFQLSSDRLELYIHTVELSLFDTDIAILAIRLGTHDLRTPSNPVFDLSFSQVLDLQDRARRLYAPFLDFDTNNQSSSPITPVSITIGQGTSQSFGNVETLRSQLEHVGRERAPTALEAWNQFLLPMRPGEDGKGLCFSLIEDERMQAMSYVAVDDPHKIGCGDWVRLATYDDSGDPKQYPYSPDFITPDYFREMAYDRFWSPDLNDSRNPTWLTTTRWLCSGYGFTVVGKDDSFFNNEEKGALVHFRYHYRRMGLIVHMHRATLLKFQAELAKILDIERAPKRNDSPHVKIELSPVSEFAESVQRLAIDFRRFCATYWTHEISNQIQGQELFDLWSRHLRTRPLFESINREIEALNNLVQTRIELANQASLVSAQNKLEWLELFIVAVYAVELPVAFAHLFGIHHHWYGALSIGMSLGSVGFLAWVTRPWDHGSKDFKSPFNGKLTHGRLLISLLIVWILWFVISFLAFADKSSPSKEHPSQNEAKAPTLTTSAAISAETVHFHGTVHVDDASSKENKTSKTSAVQSTPEAASGEVKTDSN